ncbi:Pseudouridine synthase [Hoyosella subflava DQS3-9A1]|uniref:Pseudouridine synthase n=1 Tax=Hoyosella subflava (strain DSM 45089 / JCM 17490 / NBRC 109087 / DQS3-9A1) TaxID=443218 RepID=F6EJH8_HOYSD|nr:Pseudouridine synthase [Hoyosella subflava DQS3-9A1]
MELDEHDRVWARYRLRPVTGRTHQLRVHMSALGVPIYGDSLYPQITPISPTDYTEPLRLLAHTMSFTDPLTRRKHTFMSERTLTGP